MATARKWGVFWMALGFAFVVVAILVISAGLGWSLVVGVIGVGFAAFGLRRVNHLVRPMCATSIGRCLLAGAAIVAAGVGVVILAFYLDTPGVGALGMGLIVVGLLPLSNALFHAGQLRPAWWVGAGLAIAGAAVVGRAATTLHPAIPVLAGVAGFLAFRIGIRPFCAPEPADETKSRWCTLAGAAGILAGAVCIAATAAWELALAGAAVVLIVFGFVTVSIAWPEIELRPLSRGGARLVGLVALVVAVPLLVASGMPFWAWLTAGLVVAAFGASLVLRGEGFLLVALAAFAVVWVLVPRIDDAPVDPNREAPRRILGLGDSYASGEGAPAFFEGTNVRGSNGCRRASTAYTYQVAQDLGWGLDFFACSGAKAHEIWEEGQECSREGWDATTRDCGDTDSAGVAGKEPQLDNPLTDEAKTDVVILSIGGNDALFGDLTGCAQPGSCVEFRQLWLANLAQKGPAIEEALRQIRTKVPNRPVVVVPYPIMITEEGCDWSPLDEAEHRFLFEFITILGEQVRTASFNAGVHFYEDALFAYEKNGARVCDGGGHDAAGVNVVTFQPPQPGSSIIDRLNPANWGGGSLHPKRDGHAYIAEGLAPYVAGLVNDVEDGGKANPDTPDEAGVARAPYLLPDALLRIAPVDTAELPESIACPVGEVAAFGTRTRRLGRIELRPGEPDPRPVTEEPFPLDADPGDPICYTSADGTWTSTAESPDDRVVTIEGERVLVQPVEPEEGSGTTASFVYRRAGDQTWRMLVVDFCSRDPDCPKSASDWQGQQLVTAGQRLSPLAILLFVGGWLLALGFRKPD